MDGPFITTVPVGLPYQKTKPKRAVFSMKCKVIWICFQYIENPSNSCLIRKQMHFDARSNVAFLPVGDGMEGTLFLTSHHSISYSSFKHGSRAFRQNGCNGWLAIWQTKTRYWQTSHHKRLSLIIDETHFCGQKRRNPGTWTRGIDLRSRVHYLCSDDIKKHILFPYAFWHMFPEVFLQIFSAWQTILALHVPPFEPQWEFYKHRKECVCKSS